MNFQNPIALLDFFCLVLLGLLMLIVQVANKDIAKSVAQAKFVVEHQRAVAASTARRAAYEAAHAGALSGSTQVERTPGALPAPPGPPRRVVLDVHFTIELSCP